MGFKHVHTLQGVVVEHTDLHVILLGGVKGQHTFSLLGTYYSYSYYYY